MKSLLTNLLIPFTIACAFTACYNNDLSQKTIKISEKNDSILLLYDEAKNRKLSISNRLRFINRALELSNKFDSTHLIDLYSLKNAIYSDTILNDSTLFYANRMLKLAIKKQDTEKIGKAYFKFADYYKSKSRYDSAYYYFNLSKEKYLSINDSSHVGKKLMAMARILLDDNDYYAGETTCIEALKYLSEKKDKKHIASVYHILSIISRKQFNYNEAIEQIDIALKLNKSSKNKAIYFNSKLLILRESKQYERVIKLYKELLKNESIIENKKEYARVIDNLAYTQWLYNNSLNVEDKLLEATDIRKTENDIKGLIASNSHLMKYYSKKNELKAIKHANKLYKLTAEQNNIDDKLEALSYLRNLSNISASKIYSDLYIEIKDSLTKARDIAKNKYAAIRYDSSKKEEENLELKAKNAEKDLKSTKDNNQKLALAILLIITSSIGIFINRHRKQQTKIARIKERHKTNSRLSKKLHDEVGNDLYYLLLQLQKVSGFTSDQENLKILKGFDTVYHKLRDFSRDHKIETGEEYGDELLSLLDSYGDENTKVITSELETSFWTEVSPLKKEELYWVLKELLTNMKKHSQATIVAVTFAKEKKKITVNYIDNGIGTNLKKTISKNGLSNVEIRIKDIGGTITFDSKPEEGFKANIVFTP